MTTDLQASNEAPAQPPNPRARSRAATIAIRVLIVLAILAAAVAGYAYRATMPADNAAEQPPESVVSDSVPASEDFFSEFRSKPSYAGTLGKAVLEQGETYYLPNSVYINHTGNGEWFIRSTTAPVLKDQSDAGEYPLELRVLTEPKRPRFDGGAGLEITLPQRPDYLKVCYSGDDCKYEKWLNRPYEDLRDPGFRHDAVIPLTQVLPAGGLKIEDYYEEDRPVGSLKPGQTGYVHVSYLKVVAGTDAGFVANTGYDKSIDSYNEENRTYFVKVLRTNAGFEVCPLSEAVYEVARGYVPLRSDIRVKFTC